MTIRFALCCFMMIILLCFCLLSSLACTNSNSSSSIIQVVDSVQSMGSSTENTVYQVLTFTWQVKNNDKESVLLQWVKPNLSEDLAGRLITDDVKVTVGQVIDPGKIITFDGAITFDASEMSKLYLEEKCFITDVTVSTDSTESIVNLPGIR